MKKPEQKVAPAKPKATPAVEDVEPAPAWSEGSGPVPPAESDLGESNWNPAAPSFSSTVPLYDPDEPKDAAVRRVRGEADFPPVRAADPVPLPDWNVLGHAAADALNVECMTAEDRKAFYAGDGVARATVLRDQALALAARFSVFIRS